MSKIFKALLISPKSPTRLDIYAPGYLVVSKEGIIEEITLKNPLSKYKNYRFEDHSDCVICPGFIDVHNHLPQYAFAGIGDNELLPWLKKYTFPREEKFKNARLAKTAAETFFADLIKNGTTTTVTYATIHAQATDLAFEAAQKSKIRAIIGKVMMDQNSPRFLTENTKKSLEESRRLIEKWHKKTDRLFYVLTPRFAITCSFPLLEGIGKIAREKNVYIQTHLAENLDEIAFTKKLFPKFKNYTDIYARAGLLGPKTILAHNIYLSKPEIAAIQKTGARLAHCPTSNRFLKSGIMPYRRYEKLKLVMGLGTDVAGGFSLSMFNEMKEAIENSKYLDLFSEGKEAPPMTSQEAFYLATLGGARVLSLDKEIGSLKPGKKADFLIIEHQKADPFGAKSTYNSPQEILSKLIYRANDSMIKNVYIQGEKVK